jgi:hypothetical protein
MVQFRRCWQSWPYFRRVELSRHAKFTGPDIGPDVSGRNAGQREESRGADLKPIGNAFESGSAESVLTAPYRARALLFLLYKGTQNSVGKYSHKS